MVKQTRTETEHRGALTEEIIAYRNTLALMAVTAAETDVEVLKAAIALIRVETGRLEPTATTWASCSPLFIRY